MGSELCKTCIHTKVCMKDKNLIGDVPVMGHPMFFDNDKLYEEYKERERQGFPCEDYISSVQPEIIRCKDCKLNPKYEWVGCPMSYLGEKQRPETAWCWKAERRTDE